MAYRKFKTIVPVMLLVITIAFAGCSDEYTLEVAEKLTCKVDGVEFNATKSFTAEMISGTIIINGVNNSNDTLRLLIQDQEPGVYPIKNIQNICIFKTKGQTYVPLNSADASLIILHHDTANRLIEGGFYYTADNTTGDWLEITDGYFRTTYQ